MYMLWAVVLIVLVQAEKLRYVIEICRHGGRSPDNLQVWDRDGRWPQGPGQLTPQGMRQHLLIGYELRQRLIYEEKFLSEIYNPEEINVFSTDYNRTLMSAQSQLMGLYPPEQHNKISWSIIDKAVPPITIQNLKQIQKELGQQAIINSPTIIPIHSNKNLYQRKLSPYSTVCEKYTKLMKENQVRRDIFAVFEERHEDLSLISEYFNLSHQEAIQQFPDIYDSLIANDFHGFEVPEQFKGEWFKNIRDVYIRTYNLQWYTPKTLAMLASSELLKDILRQFNAVSEQKTKQKLMIYSAHDTTLQAVLFGLNMGNINFWPEYASTIFLNLYEDDHKYYIVMFLNDKIQKMPFCEDVKCELEEFSEYIVKATFEDYEAACDVIGEVVEGSFSYFNLLIFVAASCLLYAFYYFRKLRANIETYTISRPLLGQ